ncbi:hypothetical protein EYF80_022287 [Liparis tanakae]|uniref:Uncharacterized protein n=1 Tax=Liparis tanakae TaxID=230148 RepID=A0A4Z2HPI1_9TELE|nr:hypothetical protein EYF80_022287 [Liparis tanakae]
MVSSASINPTGVGLGMSSEVYAGRILRVSIGVQHEAGEGAVLVVVAPVRFSAVQLDVNLVPGLEVQDGTVAGVVVVLIGVLGDGTGSHLEEEKRTFLLRKQVSPHAGSISASHQHMSGIERNLWDRVVSGSADGTVWPINTGSSVCTRCPSVTGRTSRSRWSGLAQRTPRTHPPDASRLSLGTLDEGWKRLNQAVVFDRVGCLGRSRGRGRGPVGVAHHLTGPEHLVAGRGPGGVHHDRDQNHQHQHQRDTTNTSCDHLRSADSLCPPERMVFQPAVVGSIPLTKATSGYQADPRLLQHLHAVEHVRLLTFGLTEGKSNITALFEVSHSGGVALLKHDVLDQ